MELIWSVRLQKYNSNIKKIN